jgi:hypothetical protein
MNKYFYVILYLIALSLSHILHIKKSHCNTLAFKTSHKRKISNFLRDITNYIRILVGE